MSDASSATPEAVKRVMPRWSKWLLIASLAFNVLIVGAVASRVWHVRHGGGFAGPATSAAGANIAVFTAGLPAERRQAVIAAIRDERQALRPMRDEARQARQAVRLALSAEPFEGSALALAQARLLEAEVKVRTASQRLIASIAVILTPEERRAFAAHINAEGQRGPRMGPGGWPRGKQDRGGPQAGDEPAQDAAKPKR